MTSNFSNKPGDSTGESKFQETAQQKLDSSSEVVPVSDADLKQADGGSFIKWSAFTRLFDGFTGPADAVTDKIAKDGYGLEKEDLH